MKNNWNLKDRLKSILRNISNTSSILVSQIYSKSEIEIELETLRQKLIEDVKSNDFINIAWDLTQYDCATSVYQRWFIKIINKRFGVKK